MKAIHTTALAVSAACLFALGCGSAEPTGSVSGTVTLDGQPLAAGEVTLSSPKGFAASAEVKSGSFTFDGEVPLGKYTFTVGPPPLTEAPGEGGDSAKLESANIPDGYSDETQSDLVHEITEGDNTVKLEMKKSGPSNAS